MIHHEQNSPSTSLTFNLHVICLTETWLSSDVPDALFTPAGYTSFRNDRKDSSGGGTLIIVKNELNPIPILYNDLHLIEASSCLLHLPNRLKLSVVCVYRPPSHNSNSIIECNSILNRTIALNCDHNIIIGDFNMPLINWNNFSYPPKYRSFMTVVEDLFLTQHINEVTRPASGNVLDLLFTTLGTPIGCISVDECFGTSDHCSVSFTYDIPFHFKALNKKFRNFSRADWNLFHTMINDCNWADILKSDNIDVIWSSFVLTINGFLDKCVPVLSFKTNSFLRNSKTRTLLRRKRRMWKLFKQVPSMTHHLQFLRCCSLLDDHLNTSTARLENRIINSKQSNPKFFWSYVSSKLRSNKKIASIIDTHSNILTENNDIASAFNQYFIDVFDTSSPALASLPSVDLNPHDIFLLPDIKRVISNLKLSFSADDDNLSYGVFKKGGDGLIHVLLAIFNKSLSLQQVPCSWKIATVYPIHKSGSRQTLSNFRPISVTSTASRIMERLIRYRLMLLLPNYILESQYGFRPRRSSEVALLRYNDYLTKTIDSAGTVDTIYLDFSKAFEKVSHTHLICKLSKYDFPPYLVTWVNNFLTNRFQKVNINGVSSDIASVSSGVIQGSVLGPLCFLLFTNDIDDIISNSLLIKYADDIKLSLASHSDSLSQINRHKLLQDDLIRLHRWSVNNNMIFNVKKTHVLHFGRNNIKASYILGDKEILTSSFEKDLGVTFEKSLSFNLHICNIVKKANSRLGIILKIFKSKHVSSVLTLYKSYVRSILEYSSIVWSPYTLGNIDRIESVQKRFCNSIPSIRSLDYKDQLRVLTIFSLKARRLRYQLIFVFKIIKGFVDVNFDDYFQFSTAHSTRSHRLSLVPKFSRNNYRRFFFTVDIINFWNELSDTEINVESISNFKRSVERFFARKNIW